MKQCWSRGDLAQFWSLNSHDKQLSDQRKRQGLLGLAVLLKFFQVEGRVPHHHKEVPLPAVKYLTEQLEAPASTWYDFALKGRSGSRDREQLDALLVWVAWGGLPSHDGLAWRLVTRRRPKPARHGWPR